MFCIFLQKKKVDIDLEDPEVEQAAKKIQGAFRGMKRKKGLWAVCVV